MLLKNQLTRRHFFLHFTYEKALENIKIYKKLVDLQQTFAGKSERKECGDIYTIVKAQSAF